MKKIFILALIVLSFGVMYADIDLKPRTSSEKSVWYSVLMPVYISYGSEESSAASDASAREKAIKEAYGYYKEFAQNEIILAEEIFSEQGLAEYGLKSKDVVKLDETNIGLLVSHNEKGIALIPSKQDNEDLLKREDR